MKIKRSPPRGKNGRFKKRKQGAAGIIASIFDRLFGRVETMKTVTARKPATPVRQTFEQWKDEQIQLGLDDLAAGRVLSHEEFMRQSDAHLKRLARKYGKAA